eukprot:s7130_g3.t1
MGTQQKVREQQQAKQTRRRICQPLPAGVRPPRFDFLEEGELAEAPAKAPIAEPTPAPTAAAEIVQEPSDLLSFEDSPGLDSDLLDMDDGCAAEEGFGVMRSRKHYFLSIVAIPR